MRWYCGLALVGALVAACSRPSSRAVSAAQEPTDDRPALRAPVMGQLDLPPPADDDDAPAHALALGRAAVFVEVVIGTSRRFEVLPDYAAAVEACFRAIPRGHRSATLPYRVRIERPKLPVPSSDRFAPAHGGPPDVHTSVEDLGFSRCVTPRLPTVDDLGRYSEPSTGRFARAFEAVAYTRAAEARSDGVVDSPP